MNEQGKGLITAHIAAPYCTKATGRSTRGKGGGHHGPRHPDLQHGNLNHDLLTVLAIPKEPLRGDDMWCLLGLLWPGACITPGRANKQESLAQEADICCFASLALPHLHDIIHLSQYEVVLGSLHMLKKIPQSTSSLA